MVRYKKNPGLNRVLVTGGAGYVGAVLVPKLLEAGYQVTVLDLYMYGEDVLRECRSNPRLREVKGDIRDGEVVKQALEGCDSVIHLACISNDPSFELNPDLGRSINLDSFVPLVSGIRAIDTELAS
jgi:nucleoside-diphosphate-sugar epimerase